MSITANINDRGKSDLHYSIGIVWEGMHMPDEEAYK